MIYGQTPEDTSEVCKQYSLQYGVTNYKDPSQVKQTRYYEESFADHRSARLTEFRYCNNIIGLLFKGFQAKFTSLDGSFEEEQTYGTVTDSNDIKCYPNANVDDYSSINGEITNFAIFVDSNDIEGLYFVTGAGAATEYRANHPIFSPNPAVALAGPLIGFRIEFGSSGITNDQPLKLEAIYNACSCPTASFFADAPPSDLSIQAVAGATVIDQIPFQQSTVGSLFSQSCGTYSVRLDPPLPDLLTLSSTGGSYTDRITLDATMHSQVGVYAVKMIIEQNQSAGDGYDRPSPGTLQSIEYDFTVTVNPCVITSVVKDPSALQQVEYSIGTSDFTFGPYSFTQNPSCSLAPTSVVINDKPDWLEYDEAMKSFTLRQTFDASLVGTYDFSITQTLKWRTSVSDPGLEDSDVSTISYKLKINPCEITQVTPENNVSDQDYVIGESGYVFGTIGFITDSICQFAFTYELTGHPSTLTYDLNSADFQLASTSDLSMRNRYNVELKATIDVKDGGQPPTITQYSGILAFSVTIQPCPNTSYSIIPVTVNPVSYELGEPGIDFANYLLTQQGSCGYLETINVTGLPSPSFITHDTTKRVFILLQTSDQNALGRYEIELTGSIDVPVDWTPSTVYRKEIVTLQIQVTVSPCTVLDFVASPSEFSPTTYELGNNELNGFGPYSFTQSPDCGYTQTVKIVETLNDDFPSSFVLHDSNARTFKVPSTLDTGFIGTYNIVIESVFDQPDYKGDKTPQKATISWPLKVLPCQVNTFEISDAPSGTFTQVLGTPAFKIGPYSYMQQPNCGYEETLTISIVPLRGFISHNNADKTFNVAKTSDNNDLGSYTITIRVKFDQLLENGTTEENFKESSFIVEVKPCTVLTYVATSAKITEKDYTLNTAAIGLGTYEFTQEPQCGYEEIVEIQGITLGGFVSHDSIAKTLSLSQTNDPADLGFYTIIILSKFDQLLPNGSFQRQDAQIQFKLNVTPCIVTDFRVVSEPIANQFYTLNTGAIILGTYEFFLEPTCSYKETIEVQGLPSSGVVNHSEMLRTLQLAKTNNPNDLGEYTIIIQSSFDQLLQNGNLRNEVRTIEFILTIQPCTVIDFKVVSNTFTADQSYTLNEPGITLGSYEFSRTPTCDYVETIEITGLPTSGIVIHDDSAKNLKLTPTNDSNDLAVYAIIIQSSFKQLKQNGTLQEKVKTIEFTLTIQPCTVIDFIVVLNTFTDQAYTLNESGMTLGSYEFKRTPACDYKETIEIIGLPASGIVTHDINAKNLNLAMTKDPSDLAVYAITIQSSFNQLIQDRSLQKKVKTIDFILTIQPCVVLDFKVVTNTFTADQAYTLNEPGITLGSYQFQRAPACDYVETIKIIGLPTSGKVTHDSNARSLKLAKTNQPSDLAVYTITIQSSYNQLQQDRSLLEKVKTIKFTLTIQPCVVLDFKVVTNTFTADQAYTLNEPGFTLGSYEFSRTPSCDYVETIEIIGLPTSNIVTHDDNAKNLKLAKTNDPIDLAVYTITIQSSFNQLQQDGTSQKKVKTIEFTLLIQPCFVLAQKIDKNTFTDKTYTLDEPGIVLGNYEFSRTPTCDYDETIKITGLPDSDIVTHDDNAKNLKLAKTNDPIDLAVYNITIESSFKQLQQNGSLQEQVQRIEFTLTIQPCIVTDYSAVSPVIANIVYTLDKPGFEIGTYAFTRQPACGYVETIQVIYLPPIGFVNHNDSAKSLNLIQTNASNDLGVYTIIILATFNQLQQDGSFLQVDTKIEFELDVQPCIVTQFKAISTPIADSNYVLDTPGYKLGDYEFVQEPACGYAQTIKIEGLPADNIVIHDKVAKTLTLQKKKDLSYINQYQIKIISSFQQLVQGGPSVSKTSEIKFTLSIGPCNVNSFSVVSDPINTIEYTLGNKEIMFGPYTFQQDPLCGYQTTETATGLPDAKYITHNEVDNTFTIRETVDPDFVGIYDVTVTSKFQSPQDNGSFKTETASFQFQIRINTCTVIEYKLTSTPIQPVAYALGGAPITFAAYKFEQVPACGYIETVTFVNLPQALVKANTSSRNFEIQQPTLDQSLLGDYEITIKSQFTQPLIDDSTRVVDNETKFILNVNPCVITDFSSTVTIDPAVTYKLGDASRSFGSYLFQQSPQCGYIQTVSTEGLPSFITLDEDSKQFQLAATSNFAFLKTYSVKLNSELKQPENNSKTPTYKVFKTSQNFEVIVSNPCFDAVLESFTVENMETTVLGAQADIQELAARLPKDNVSTRLGDKSGMTYCGERQFRIISSGAKDFLSYNEEQVQLVLLSRDKQDQGTLTITLQAYLVDYPSVVVSSTFETTIGACQVINLQPEQNSNEIYEIKGESYEFTFKEFTQVPDCQVPVTYEVNLREETEDSFAATLPSWVTQNDRVIFIETNDLDLIGSYEIRVKGFITQNPDIKTDTMLQLDIISVVCQFETVQKLTNQALTPIDYEIDFQDPYKLLLSWQRNVTTFDCPIDFQLEIEETSSNSRRRLRAPTDAELQIISFDSETEELTIDTSDFSYHGIEWTVKVTMQSKLSKQDNASATYSLDVSFIDVCTKSKLKAPKFTDETLIFSLFQPQNYFFDNMENLSEGPTFCGGFTYQLVYLGGPMSDNYPTSSFKIEQNNADQHKAVGTPMQLSWIGTHVFEVRGINGQLDVTPGARGNNGFFQSVQSKKLTVIIRDPCLSTKLDPERIFAEEMAISVPFGETESLYEVPGPKDSVSIRVGNGYDLCGERVFNIYRVDGSPYKQGQVSSALTMTTRKSDSLEGADVLQLKLKSFEVGPVIIEELIVVVQLKDYPEISHVVAAIKLEFRECFTDDFSGPIIERQIILVGDAPYSVLLPFKQAPCSFELEYEAVLVDLKTKDELSLPDFVSLSLLNDTAQTVALDFAKTTISQTGDYTIRVYGTMQNYFFNTTFFDILVTVFEPSDIDWSTKPDFNVDVQDLFVRVGQAITYAPTFTIKRNEWSMRMQVNLGRANKFTRYDSLLRKFYTIADLVEQVDIGAHEVQIVALFESPFGTFKTFRDSFFINVYEPFIDPNDDGIDDGSGSDTLIIDDLDIDARKNFIPEAVEKPDDGETESDPSKDDNENLPSRPKPYIARITETGLITIAWDREMEMPPKYEDIPQKKVQVLSTEGFTSYDVQQRVEFGWFKTVDQEVLRVALIDALEVRILQDDIEREPINFTWDIVNYEDESIDLQLNIRNPESIGDDFGEPDTLSITFWGTKFFKSTAGRQVRYGSEIQANIMRQLNSATAEILATGLVYIKGSVVLIVFSTLVLFSYGSLLPMWVFFNSLQIITHSTLLNTLMPGTVHYVFKDYLNLVRLNFTILNSAFIDRYSYRQEGIDNGNYNIFLEASDYVHYFTHNLVIILIIGLVILLTWAGLAIKDRLGSRHRYADRPFFMKKHEASANNFTLRFIYEFFLEISICALVSISVTSDGWQQFLSLVAGILLILVFGMLVSLFFRSGPFLEGFYEKGTFLESFWAARPFDTNFNAQSALNRQKTRNARNKVKADKLNRQNTARLVDQTLSKVVPIDLECLAPPPQELSKQPNSQCRPIQQDLQRMSLNNEVNNAKIFVQDRSQLCSPMSQFNDDLPNKRLPTPNPMIHNSLTMQGQLLTAQTNCMPGVSEISANNYHENTASFQKGTGLKASLQDEESKQEAEIGAGLDFDRMNFSRGNTSPKTLQQSTIEIREDNSITVQQDNNYDSNGYQLQRQSVESIGSTTPVDMGTQSLIQSSTRRFEGNSALNFQNSFENRTDNKDDSGWYGKGLRKQTGPMINIMRHESVDPETSSKGKHTPHSQLSIADTNMDQKGQQSPIKAHTTNVSQIHEKNYLEDHQLYTSVDDGLLNQPSRNVQIDTPAFPSRDGLQRNFNSRGEQSSQVNGSNQGNNNRVQLIHHLKTQSQALSEQNQDQIGGGTVVKIGQTWYEGGEEETQIDQDNNYNSSQRLRPQSSNKSLKIVMHAITHKPATPQLILEHDRTKKSKTGKGKKPKKPKHTVPNYQFFSTQKIKLDKKRTRESEARREHEKILRQSAKETVAGADLIKKQDRVKTLYYGLKLNHPRNVALLHPLMFLIRRLVYALSIVFLAGNPFFGVWILMHGTLLMLAFAVTEMPWRDPLINRQHQFNELTTYLICIVLLLFNNFVPTFTREVLGYCMIGIISVFLVYNAVIMMRKVTRLLWLLLIKWRALRRWTKLQLESRAISHKIKITLDAITKPEQLPKVEHSDDDYDSETSVKQQKQQREPHIIHMVVMKQVKSGGLSATIARDEKAMDLLRQPVYESDQEDKDLYIPKWKLSKIQIEKRVSLKGKRLLTKESDSVGVVVEESKSRIELSSRREPTYDGQLITQMDDLNTDRHLLSNNVNSSRPSSQHHMFITRNSLLSAVQLQQDASLRPFSGQESTNGSPLRIRERIILDQTNEIKEEKSEGMAIISNDDTLIAIAASEPTVSDDEIKEEYEKSRSWFAPDDKSIATDMSRSILRQLTLKSIDNQQKKPEMLKDLSKSNLTEFIDEAGQLLSQMTPIREGLEQDKDTPSPEPGIDTLLRLSTIMHDPKPMWPGMGDSLDKIDRCLLHIKSEKDIQIKEAILEAESGLEMSESKHYSKKKYSPYGAKRISIRKENELDELSQLAFEIDCVSQSPVQEPQQPEKDDSSICNDQLSKIARMVIDKRLKKPKFEQKKSLEIERKRSDSTVFRELLEQKEQRTDLSSDQLDGQASIKIDSEQASAEVSRFLCINDKNTQPASPRSLRKMKEETKSPAKVVETDRSSVRAPSIQTKSLATRLNQDSNELPVRTFYSEFQPPTVPQFETKKQSSLKFTSPRRNEEELFQDFLSNQGSTVNNQGLKDSLKLAFRRNSRTPRNNKAVKAQQDTSQLTVMTQKYHMKNSARDLANAIEKCSDLITFKSAYESAATVKVDKQQRSHYCIEEPIEEAEQIEAQFNFTVSDKLSDESLESNDDHENVIVPQFVLNDGQESMEEDFTNNLLMLQKPQEFDLLRSPSIYDCQPPLIPFINQLSNASRNSIEEEKEEPTYGKTSRNIELECLDESSGDKKIMTIGPRMSRMRTLKHTNTEENLRSKITSAYKDQRKLIRYPTMGQHLIDAPILPPETGENDVNLALVNQQQRNITLNTEISIMTDRSLIGRLGTGIRSSLVDIDENEELCATPGALAQNSIIGINVAPDSHLGLTANRVLTHRSRQRLQMIEENQQDIERGEGFKGSFDDHALKSMKKFEKQNMKTTLVSPRNTKMEKSYCFSPLVAKTLESLTKSNSHGSSVQQNTALQMISAGINIGNKRSRTIKTASMTGSACESANSVPQGPPSRFNTLYWEKKAKQQKKEQE